MRNPAAKVPKAARSDAVGSCAGKKCVPICWAKKPNRAKSYHSSMLPTTPAITPRRTARGVRNSWVMTPGGGIGTVADMAGPPCPPPIADVQGLLEVREEPIYRAQAAGVKANGDMP